jgi:hypothetical protein
MSAVNVPNTGTAPIDVVFDGTNNHQSVIAEFLPTAASTSPTKLSADGHELPIASNARLVMVAASAYTRPANTTAYVANDLVGNSTTAASVTAISFTATDVNDAPLSLERCRIASTDTGLTASVAFRIWFYQSDPTASSGVVSGDHVAFSTKQGNFIGSMTGSFFVFSNGAVAVCTPEAGSRIITKPTSGAKTVFALLQTLNAFTPISASTFTLTLEGLQGRT